MRLLPPPFIRQNLGLIAARCAVVGLLCLAGGTVADAAFPGWPLAELVGAVAGVLLGIAADQAAVAYGVRQGRLEMQEHAGRQADSRRRSGSLGNVPRDLPLRPGGGTSAMAAATIAQAARTAAAAAVSARAAADRAAGLEVVDDQGDGTLVTLDEASAITKLRDLMLSELRPTDLVGQQGRGVIQLAAELGPQVPVLDPETVVDYITDHVLTATGQDPVQPHRWHGVLALVAVLDDPTGGRGAEVTDAQLLGIDEAAAPFLDAVVHVLSRSGVGLAPAQLRVALGAKGYQVGSYALAGALKYLVDQGRIQRLGDGWRYTLTDAELERRAAAGGPIPADQRLPLDVVFSVLAGAGDEGMAVAEVAAEAGLVLGRSCTLGATVAALDALVSAGRAAARDGRFFARNPLAESLISGPGLRERILTAAAGAPLGGLTLAELTELVDADGFGAGEARVRDMAAELERQGRVVVTDGRYSEPPF